MRDFYAMPGHLIRRAHQTAGALFAEEVGELTPVQFAALSAIAANPGVDATRLSALIAFDRSTIGGVLERMEAKGWIARGPAAGDRRAKLLRVTAEGEVLLRAAEAPVRRVQERLLAPLSPAERATFLALLAQLSAPQPQVREEEAAPLRRVAGR